LAELADLAPVLDDYQPFHAAQADLLARAGQGAAARTAYDRAIALAPSAADAAFLAKRRDQQPI
jgi:RNA polymerase sigma-70 factor (ECF subfamily)